MKPNRYNQAQSEPVSQPEVRGPDCEAQRLIPAVYGDGRRLARAKRRAVRENHTLQTTDVLHEALFKVLQERKGGAPEGRVFIWFQLARAIRQILIEHDRAKNALKRGDGVRPAELDPAAVGVPGEDPSIREFHALLLRMEHERPELLQVLHLRYDRDMTQDSIATSLGVNRRAVQRLEKEGRDWLLERVKP